MALFHVTAHDQEFYETRIQPFLPEHCIDMHTHVWERSDRPPADAWPSLVADENPVSHLTETYRLMFPDKAVTPVIFGMPEYLDASPEDQERLRLLNGYVEREALDHAFPSLLLTHPSWSCDELEVNLAAHYGAKVYLDMAPGYLPRNELRIFDFLTPAHLDVLNGLGKIVMLHIPRPGRLKDPVNLAQLMEIENRWPDVRLIVAHVGRASCDEDVGNAFEIIASTERMMFDFSANTNEHVFEQLIRTVGPKRILFGSDLPIFRMRARRICEDGTYINIVPAGLYDGIGSYAHMREAHGPESDKLTFFLYEEIDAFRRASEKTGLDQTDIDLIFNGNAAALIKDGPE